MENAEPNNNKIPVTSKVDQTLYAVIEQFRIEEDRNMSNMIERLLKTHPRVQEILESVEGVAA